MKLEASETAVLQAASRIFSAYVVTRVVTEANHEEMELRAVQAALRMARITADLLQSPPAGG